MAEEYQGQPARLENFTVQDSIVLNVQRGCEAAIDMAMHGVAKRRLGVPQDARSAFELLAVERVIDRELAERMKLRVGFRNRAIHEYQQLQIGILRRILEERLADLPRLARQLLDA